VDVELFKPRDKRIVRRALNLPSDKVIIGYVGNADINRGFDLVARLATELGGDEVKFLIAYSRIGNLTRAVIGDVKRALRKNALIIRRPVPIWHIYNAVDILLLPICKTYPTEPPATLIEALASGTPVIGGASPSMQDYEDLYIKMKDNDYADAVGNIAMDKGTLHELRERSREFAIKNLSYQAVARRLKKTLNKWISDCS
jgi:glycosyltransferase involved in cell wall biosynthesis